MTMKKDKWYGSLSKALVFVLFCIMAAGVVIPLLWMLLSSLKNNTEFLKDPWGVPAKLLFINYANAFKQGVGQYFLNSVIVTACAVVLIIVIGFMASYALARIDFPGRNLIFLFLLGGMMISPEVNLISLFNLMKKLKLYNTHAGLILVYCAFELSFTILLMRSYLLALPREMEESALIDGCSLPRLLLQIIVPLSKPVIASAALLSVMTCWNEYMFAAIFVESNSLRTLPVGLASLQKAVGTNYPVLVAGLTISALVVIILFLIFQKQFIRGISQGSLKG